MKQKLYQKLAVSQLVKKFAVFNVNLLFVTESIKSRL
jgi:hypothetical protein